MGVVGGHQSGLGSEGNMSVDEKLCKTCAWWVAEEKKGSCRQDGPKNNVRNPFPYTMPHHWCRHWSPTRGWLGDRGGQ